MSTVVIAYDALFHGPKPHEGPLRAAGFELRYPGKRLTEEAETIEALKGAAAVIAGGEPYSERVLAALPQLRVCSRSGVGVDRVDLEAATRHGIVVTITPQANHEAVAEHTMALLLALSRSIPQRNQDVRRGVWSKVPYLPLRGKTLGLIGLGRIGRAVAERAAPFRLTFLAHEAYPDVDFARSLGIELVDLDTLLSRSDYVSLHVPLTAETRGLINRKTLGRMKRGSFVVNTARGGLIVEEDLLAALQAGHLAGAGLDVFAEEPSPTGNPLFQLENVVASPHMAGGDTQSLHDMARDAAQNIIDLAQGRWPQDAVVNATVRPGWRW